jgi:hypothetical protein
LRHIPLGNDRVPVSNDRVPVGNDRVPVGNVRATRAQRRGSQRSVWRGLRGSIRHDRQRVPVELHDVDIGGSEGDRQPGVLYDVPERDELDLGECDYNRGKCSRTWDDQRNDHHGHAGHRATE